MSAFVHILRCADGSYYVGSARGDTLDKRIGEHQGGEIHGYTSTRRPVTLVFAEQVDRITDAIAAERRIKGWSRAKKEALTRGNWSLVQWLAKRPGGRARAKPVNPDPEMPERSECFEDDGFARCVLRGSSLTLLRTSA
jgi:putative endonuclease